MRLVISNQTQDCLLCNIGKHILLVPPFSESDQLSLECTSLSLSKCSPDAILKEFTDVPASASMVSIKLSVTPGRTWQRVAVPAGIDWVIYRNRVCYKCHVFTVFPFRDVSCFLASIPDSIPLSSLMLPGTHETMAFYGWPISQCQTRPLDAQLHAGIRVIDIRLSIVGGRLIAHHGILSEVTPFADILVTLHGFLTCPATASEAVVVSIKQEDSDTQLFPKLVQGEIVASPGGLEMWFLENRIPNLGEVRGKAVMFSRFGSDGWENGANGIHPPIWPDSVKEGFEWECGQTLVRTQDWYNIPSFFSIPEKTALSTEILVSSQGESDSVLSISFMSASSVPWALPPVIACGLGWPNWGLGFEGVNARVGKWLLNLLGSPPIGGTDAGSQIRGWALMDYYTDPAGADVVPLLVECNFRGTRPGTAGRGVGQSWPGGGDL